MLKVIMDSLDSLSDELKKLYTEKDGKFHLTGVEGMKTQSDVDYVQNILVKERDAHKETKRKLTEYDEIRALNLTSTEILAKLDRVDELEAAAGDKIDENKLNEMAEARAKTRIAPLEREIEKLKKEQVEKDTALQEYSTKERTRTIHDAVREAALKSKIVPTALDDVLMIAERSFDVDPDSGKIITKDGVGVTPGIDPAVWLTDMQDKRPHWWPTSQGGGANGGSSGGGYANNPFSASHWNMTEQGRLVGENRERAKQMAKAAGTTIGGPRPQK